MLRSTQNQLSRESSGRNIEGKLELVDVAWARIEFLSRVVDPNLLEASMQGDEEALCKLQKFLHDKRWCIKAKNLNIRAMGVSFGEEEERTLQNNEDIIIGFILAIGGLVQPNVMDMVKRRSNEGIRIALDQIHQGSVKSYNSREHSSSINFQGYKTLKKFDRTMQVAKWKVEREFIANNHHLVDNWVLEEALKGEIFYINRALGQIHERSLEESYRTHPRKSYKETLLN